MARLRARLRSRAALLNELNYYVKGGRFVVGLLALTSVGGWIALPKYVDELVDRKVSERVGKLERVYFASNLANAGMFKDSLAQMDLLWEEVKAGPPEQNAALYDLYGTNLLFILSNLEEKKPDGTWLGTEQWDNLRKSRYYNRTFELGNQWSNDPYVLNNLGRCILKFDTSAGALAASKASFKRSATLAMSGGLMAANNFGLAFFAIGEGNYDEAESLLFEAISRSPSTHTFSFWTRTTDELLQSYDGQMWSKAMDRSAPGRFRKHLDEFLKRLRQRYDPNGRPLAETRERS